MYEIEIPELLRKLRGIKDPQADDLDNAPEGPKIMPSTLPPGWSPDVARLQASGGQSPVSQAPPMRSLPPSAMMPVSTSTQPGDIPTELPLRPVSSNNSLPLSLFTRATEKQPPQPVQQTGGAVPRTAIEASGHLPSPASGMGGAVAPVQLPPPGLMPRYAPPEVEDNRLSITPPKTPTSMGPNDDRRNVAIPRLPGEKGDPRPYDPIEAARYDYLLPRIPTTKGTITLGDGSTAETLTARKPTTGERLKAGLKTAGLGMLQAIATAPPNSNLNQMLGRAIGGAGGGFAGGAISPKGAAELQFNTFQRPALEAEEQQRKEREKEQMALRKAALEFEYRKALTDKARTTTIAPGNTVLRPGEEPYTAPNKPQAAPRPAASHIVQGVVDGVPGFYDANDAEIRSKIQPMPKVGAPGRGVGTKAAMDQAEVERLAAEGSVEQIADDTLKSRMDSIRAALPGLHREILEKGTVTSAGGRTRSATSQEKQQAQRAFDEAIARERRTVLANVRGEAKKKNAARAREIQSGSPSGASDASQPRSLRGLREQYLQ